MTALLPFLLLLQPPTPWLCRAYLHGNGDRMYGISQRQPLERFTRGFYVPNPRLTRRVTFAGDGPIRAQVRPTGGKVTMRFRLASAGPELVSGEVDPEAGSSSPH